MIEYKFAAQNKLRFPSTRGDLTTEQLFDLPLKAPNGFDLDSVARSIHGVLKTKDEESFVEDPSANPQKEILTTMLSIVKDVIKTKQEANAVRLNRLRKADERKKILDAIAAKQDQQLSAASLEELSQKLAALDAAD